MSIVVLPLLLALFSVLGVGVLLRATGRMGEAESDVVQRVVMDVTLPALLLRILASGGDDGGVGGLGLVASMLALVVTCSLSVLVARGFRASGPAQGSAMLAGGFSNTGFLGVPLLIAAFPGDGTAATTAIAIDALCTTVGLWVFGFPIAARLARGPGRQEGGSLLKLLLRPLSLALLVGVAMRLLQVPLPGFLDGAMDGLGRCTSPLVFLALGLQLDLRAVASRALLAASLVVIQLVVEPLLALAFVRMLGVSGTAGVVVVLQAAMPSAMASMIVAGQAGCDRQLAAAVAMLSTLLCLASIPTVAWLMERL
jgi:hypothetical protein